MLIWRKIDPKILATVLLMAAERYAAQRTDKEKNRSRGALREKGGT